MYFEYFGLKQPPFRITPDTSLFFPGGNRGAILEALIYAVCNGEGIVKVVGEVGSGKTMLCRMLEQELPDRVVVVYLANPNLSPENILHVIAFELELAVSADAPRLQLMHALQEYLLARHAENRQVVMFVEEAQGMPIATLEEIRLLSNLETCQNKLLQIVLFGQPELDEKLSRAEIRQLKERITYSFQLPPFRPNDIRDYLNARLRACGCRAAELFSPAAVHAIAVYSHGLVRRINILADKSLLAAYAESHIQVNKSHVGKAARDSEFTPGRTRRWLPALAMGAAALVVAATLVWWIARSDRPEAVAEIPAGAPTPWQSLAGASGVPGEVPEVPDAFDTDAVPPAQAGEVIVPAGPLQPEPAPVLSGDATPAGAGAGLTPEPNPDAITPAVAPGAETVPQSLAIPPSVLEPAPTAGVDSGPPVDSPPVFQLQDTDDPTLSMTERAMLKLELSLRPPEEAPASSRGTTDPPCELCLGIVYRPVWEPESL